MEAQNKSKMNLLVGISSGQQFLVTMLTKVSADSQD